MPKVMVLTFVIGETAAAAVYRQLSRARPPAPSAQVRSSLMESLRQSPRSFQTRITTGPGSEVRLAWRGGLDGAGLLFAIQDDQLRAVNLLLAGCSKESDQRGIAQARDLLGPISSYSRCLDLIQETRRPSIAMFCDRDGRLGASVDAAVLRFAEAFFGLCQEAKAPSH